MRFTTGLVASLVFTLLESTAAFQSTSFAINHASKKHRPTMKLLASTTNEDCGCAIENVSGKPTAKAITLNPYDILTTSQSKIFELSGKETSLSQILPQKSKSMFETKMKTPISIVVFLRSFG